ncbi:MAG: hypothetical protein IJ748_01375 [Bacteroidales bacterium]|nr:hypothetical protein [Bacteroidales bacterium]
MTKSTNDAGDGAKWFIAECKPTRERTLRKMLSVAGYKVYIASQTEVHKYKSRNKRTVERILLPGKVFVFTQEKELMNIMLAFPILYRFQKDHAGSLNEFGAKPFAFVPEQDMKKFQDFLQKSPTPVLIKEELVVGEKVKVIYGPLEGTEGIFYRSGKSSYIVIEIMLGSSYYAYAEVSVDDVIKIEPKENSDK